MSYLPTSAGHATKEAPRAVEQETINERLIEMVERWLACKECDSYARAVEITEGIIVSSLEAAVLARHPRFSSIDNHAALGMFISALWNERCAENTIINPYDISTLSYVGFKLPTHKTLIIKKGGGAHCTGNYAAGTIIARQGFVRECGFHATGMFIAPEHVTLSEHFCGKLITLWQYGNALGCKKYIEKLLDPKRSDSVKFESEFGTSKEIATKIKRLLGGRA